MSGGTVVPRHECPGGRFFQGDSHVSDTVFLILRKKNISHINSAWFRVYTVDVQY